MTRAVPNHDAAQDAQDRSGATERTQTRDTPCPATVAGQQARAMLAATMTEKALQDAVIKTAGIGGYDVYHTHDSRRSQPGFPDLVCLNPDRENGPQLLFIELKSARGRLSPAQRYWLGRLRRAGCPAVVWRPADWLSGDVARVLCGEDVV